MSSSLLILSTPWGHGVDERVIALAEMFGVFFQGVKEVTLLGQNVNSYRDTSQEQFCGTELTQLSRGFKTIYRTKQGGLRFSDLLDQVSRIDPDMRIRFTSPHPKDFPDEVQ